MTEWLPAEAEGALLPTEVSNSHVAKYVLPVPVWSLRARFFTLGMSYALSSVTVALISSSTALAVADPSS